MEHEKDSCIWIGRGDGSDHGGLRGADTGRQRDPPGRGAEHPSGDRAGRAGHPGDGAFPQDMDYFDENDEWDSEAWTAANEAWYADYEARTENMDATMDGLSERFLPMMSALLAGSNGENRICSPLNVYMALAMLAECIDGESRTQILNALGEDDIEAAPRAGQGPLVRKQLGRWARDEPAGQLALAAEWSGI